MTKPFGKQHQDLLDWLKKEWWLNGPAVCVVEGFPGVGKTFIAEELMDRLVTSARMAVMAECPNAGLGTMDDLLLTLSEQFNGKGDARLAEGLNTATLKAILDAPVLLVLDEFQNAFQAGSGRPVPELERFLEDIARNRPRGRILLLSSRDLERARWNERHAIRPLSGLPPDEAVSLLDHFLQEEGVTDALPDERKRDLAQWLGGYPRAMRLLANRLRFEPANELVGLATEAWEAQDRKVSPDLLRRFEKEILQRARAGLDPHAERFLKRLAVFRHSVETEAMKRLLDLGEDLAGLRDELIARFMIELRRGRYVMHPILRDTVLAGLEGEFRRQAHRLAGDFFGRHFRAEQIVGAPEKLGGAFVEARYHYVHGGHSRQLKEIGQRFEAHVRAVMGWVTPIPSDQEELDERIAFLSALLSDESGPKSLHFYLAKLLTRRRHPGDMKRALHHAGEGTGPYSPSEAWVMRIRLEAEVNGTANIAGIVARIARHADVFAGLAEVYVAAASALDRAGQWQEAVALLREGIGRVPADKSLQSLYQSAGEILDRAGEWKEAVALLREGIGRVGAEQNVFELYQSAGEILDRAGQWREAVALLREGIGRVPADKSLQSLYQSAGEILDRAGEWKEAVALLREGIGRVGADQNLFSLYQSAAKILDHNGDTAGVLAVLREGLQAIPKGRGGRYYLKQQMLYIAYAASDQATLQSLVTAWGEEGTEQQQTALGRVLLRELAGDWPGAATLAAGAREVFPTYLDLAARESFARLCAGQVAAAREALERFPHKITAESGNPLAWLQAFIALKNEDLRTARKYLGVYLGQSWEGDAAALQARLLRAWDEDAASFHAQHPAYYFPHLPPSLTGLSTTATRRQFGPCVLDQKAVSPSSSPAPLPSVVQSRSRAILAIADEWFSRRGGLSTFNRDLCIALHGAGHRVVCLVCASTPEEAQHALQHGVTLVDARSESGIEDSARLCLRVDMPEGFRPDIIIGHDHITGTAAKVQATDFFPGVQRVHFIHTAPGEIEWFKQQKPDTTAAAKAEDKERKQLELAISARLVVAVGPRLHDEMATSLAGRSGHLPPHRLDPGLGQLHARDKHPPKPRCLLLGRTEDAELKGLDIAARALGLMQDKAPSLMVRGAEPGKGDELQKWLHECAERDGLDIRTREYTPELGRLAEDLGQASLLLMPSRREGFGLVGLEALAAGTPILVSDQSGLAALIQERVSAEMARLFVVPVTGNREKDAAAWERAIDFVMRDRGAAFHKANELAKQLAETLTWEGAVAGLMRALDDPG